MLQYVCNEGNKCFSDEIWAHREIEPQKYFFKS
ncbi:MAG: hypothetical protein ACI845_001413 [Gammaproteobacteria bacterium]|jgi:hypothetical protein